MAVIASILSSYKRRNYKENYVFLGEVGLSGEIRYSHLQLETASQLKKFGLDHLAINIEDVTENPINIDIVQMASVEKLGLILE